MASPQTENGYTRIANEVLEALCRQILSPYETRVLMFIVRNTWGRQKKMDQFSVSRIARETGLDRGNAGRALRSLISHKIVVADAGEYGFQKNYDEWKSVSRKTHVSPKTLCLPRPKNGVSQDHKTVVIRDTHIKKERKERNTAKDKPSPDSFFPIVEKTIRRLNELAGTSYRPNTKVTADHINARISEGYTLEDFETVLESKWDEWKDNLEMRKFYRPKTLFSPEHFEAYLQAAKLNGNGNGADRKPEMKDLGGGMVEVEGTRMERQTYEQRYGRAD